MKFERNLSKKKNFSSIIFSINWLDFWFDQKEIEQKRLIFFEDFEKTQIESFWNCDRNLFDSFIHSSSANPYRNETSF